MTEAVPTVEIIPVPEMEISKPDLFSSIKALEQDAAVLAELRAKAESIAVCDVSTYAAIGEVLTQVRLVKEAPSNRLGWVSTIVQRAKAFLDTHSKKVTNECALIEDICKKKLKIWEQREVAAAEVEQKQVNKDRAKQGLPPAEVKPNIAPISGYRRSTTYKATFDTPADFDRLLKAWKNCKDKKQWSYLRQFITFDVKKLNEEARDLKDPKELMKRIPGCRAWSD